MKEAMGYASIIPIRASKLNSDTAWAARRMQHFGQTRIGRMPMWPDRRIVELFKIEHPILLGPMAGAVDFELAVAVANGGGLGAIPCAMLTGEQLREQLGKYRAATKAPVNVNFFCHTPPV